MATYCIKCGKTEGRTKTRSGEPIIGLSRGLCTACALKANLPEGMILKKASPEYQPTESEIAEVDRWWRGLKPLTKLIIMEDYRANEIGGERR